MNFYFYAYNFSKIVSKRRRESLQFFNNPHHFPIFFPTDGHLCNKDLENLKKWNPNEYLMIERAKVLAPQGVEDMRLLARRLQSSFPHLLQPNNNENITERDYVVRITRYQEKKLTIYRFFNDSIDLFQFKESDAYNSMGAFMEGLFKSRDVVDSEKVPENDTLLTVINIKRVIHIILIKQKRIIFYFRL